MDRQCAERVVRLSDKIKEQDVEVVELRLDQEERLNEYSFYFEDDAWLAVGANIQHSTEAQGLIVPVFTESEDEKFWLFYTIQNPSKLVKASFTYKIKGYWLDLQGQSNYKLLNMQSSGLCYYCQLDQKWTLWTIIFFAGDGNFR